MNLHKILAGCVGVVAVAQLAGAQTPYNQLVSRILGQAVLQRNSLTAIAPNLAEGREFNNPQAVALDTSVTPNILYVGDTGNNRVLAWKNASALANGSFADMILGQPDNYSTSAQGPSAGTASAVSYYFNSPVAVAVIPRAICMSPMPEITGYCASEALLARLGHPPSGSRHRTNHP